MSSRDTGGFGYEERGLSLYTGTPGDRRRIQCLTTVGDGKKVRFGQDDDPNRDLREGRRPGVFESAGRVRHVSHKI